MHIHISKTLSLFNSTNYSDLSWDILSPLSFIVGIWLTQKKVVIFILIKIWEFRSIEILLVWLSL